MTFAEKILQFNQNLSLEGVQLPDGIRAMNPFREGNQAIIERVTKEFYHKYYHDNSERKIILGINPGRLGAGATGVPFSDTKRLAEKCDIQVPELKTHEPSSVFVYEVIEDFGEVADFYKEVYISSLCPLGFVKMNDAGKEVNYNFYDQKDLQEAVTPFIVETLRQQIAFGINTRKVMLMGTGKNYKFFKKLNEEHQFFEEVVPLEHPRYVMQYKAKTKSVYIDKYLEALGSF